MTGNDGKGEVCEGSPLHAALTEAMYDHGRWQRPGPPPDAEWTVTTDCPVEAVFSDGRVPCTLPKGHAEPHVYGDTVLPFDDEGE